MSYKSILAGLGTQAMLATLCRATPVLLASYSFHDDAAHAPAPQDDPSIQLILQGAVEQVELHPATRALGGGIFWRNGDQGTIIFDRQNTPTFADFANHITNGIDETMTFWGLDEWGGGSGCSCQESVVLDKPSDLIGNYLDEVRLTVHSIYFTDYQPSPDWSGFGYVADMTWSFWGTPIPEPTTIVLFAIFHLWARRTTKSGVYLTHEIAE